MAPSGKSSGAIPDLIGVQRDASDPRDHVWLSASAGTGKTSVLTMRVLRLLLRGEDPAAILCLTFTKAGASEMAARINKQLTAWVMMPDAALAKDLFALSENGDPASLARARQLFARVLDSPGGGIRIMTIHALCQTLLCAFPLEAQLSPGFRPMEAREEAALTQSVLADLVARAEREGDETLLGALAALSLRLGEDEARNLLKSMARYADTLAAMQGGIVPRVRSALGVPIDYRATDIADACADDRCDLAGLRAIAAMYAGWATKTGLGYADTIADWIRADPTMRAAMLDDLRKIWVKADGDLRDLTRGPKNPDFPELAMRLAEWVNGIVALRDRTALADAIASALIAGQRFAVAYDEAKRARGLVDFDDLIRKTASLLSEPGIGDWIRFKQDQRIDHILVDEAQDTNNQQWAIIRALTDEFFVGAGARGSKLRTLFVVGDLKQAIFGFQGTDPIFYEAAGQLFDQLAEGAIDPQVPARPLNRLSLGTSFRSAQPILDLVDRVMSDVGPAPIEVNGVPERHISHDAQAYGAVTLLPPVVPDEAGGDDAGEENWAGDAVRALATRIARQVRGWIDERLWLAKQGRPIAAGDVMILLRARGELASLLVARLRAEGVPVAGVDRLRLRAPLAVRDLMACVRFVLQPHDDLNLAALLVSPILGWSQQALYDVAHGRAASLWQAMPDGESRDALLAMLNAADRATPFDFLEELLSGPLQARRKLIARLGEESRDPIDELLNAALQFAAEGASSLQGFVDWFDRGDGEIVRDPDAAGGAVRVMTVHGAKGLQAPVVILADATGRSDAARRRDLKWSFDDDYGELPIFRPRADERRLAGPLQTAADEGDARERAEYWRLLYVALTRAEEQLFIAGALTPSAKGEVHPESWYAAVERAMSALGAAPVDDPVWHAPLLRFAPIVKPPAKAHHTPSKPVEPIARPAWLDMPAPAESRPPRPLRPSSLGEESVADAPFGPGDAAAARRGLLLHALFERLPAVAPSQRRGAGSRWLAAQPDASPDLLDVALGVIDAHPDLFDAEALTEAPVAGIVDGVVISGVIDRLVIRPDRVLIVDFKTGCHVPENAERVPPAYLRQMAAYSAIIGGAFPGSHIEAALLYTAEPRLIMLPDALLDRHKSAFVAA